MRVLKCEIFVFLHFKNITFSPKKRQGPKNEILIIFPFLAFHQIGPSFFGYVQKCREISSLRYDLFARFGGWAVVRLFCTMEHASSGHWSCVASIEAPSARLRKSHCWKLDIHGMSNSGNRCVHTLSLNKRLRTTHTNLSQTHELKEQP